MIFLRHPVTSAGPDVCYGQLDIGLGSGAEQDIAMALSAVKNVSAIHSSDLTRCKVVAERFAARDHVTPIYDERLREYHFGDWEGRKWSEIPRTESDPWTEDLWGIAPPGGETFAALHDRVDQVLKEIPQGTLVIAHAGVIRAARMILTGASFQTVFAEKIPFCQPITFTSRAA